METKPSHPVKTGLENDPVVDQDAGTQALRVLEESLQGSDDVPASEVDRTGTNRDQTGEGENMATES